jgi:glycosyltransferase involved in cell wall biosynthesis
VTDVPKVADAPLAGLRVVHFGHFDPAYSRNRIVAKALRHAGADVRVVADPRPYASRTPSLVRRALRGSTDLVVVGFPGHADVAAAKAVALSQRAPVLFDAFVSLQESAEDRGRVPNGWLGRRRLTLEDRLSCRLADRVLVDTEAHGEHFATELATPRAKLRRLWVGADDDVMRPLPEEEHDDFRVFVYASFIPLHGLDHVVRAAAVLEKRGETVQIEIVGAGDTEASVRALAEQLRVRSITFAGRLPYDELPVRMARSDLCLGIFGTSPKAGRVIPNKVFDALACARAVVTRDSPAVRELLTPGTDVWVCAPGDPEALADAIVTLRHDGDLRRSIAARGYDRFRASASLDALARDLAVIVGELV